MSIQWSNNTLKMGAITVGRVELRNGAWVAVCNLPGISNVILPSPLALEAKKVAEGLLNHWLALAKLVPSTSQVVKGEVRLGIQSGTVVQVWGLVNILASVPNSSGECTIIWSPIQLTEVHNVQ